MSSPYRCSACGLRFDLPERLPARYVSCPTCPLLAEAGRQHSAPVIWDSPEPEPK